MIVPDLASCPHCGQSRLGIVGFGPDPTVNCSVYCMDCGTRGPVSPDIQSAMLSWNQGGHSGVRIWDWTRLAYTYTAFRDSFQLIVNRHYRLITGCVLCHGALFRTSVNTYRSVGDAIIGCEEFVHRISTLLSGLDQEGESTP